MKHTTHKGGKLVAVLCAALLLVLLLCACGGGAPTDEPAPAADPAATTEPAPAPDAEPAGEPTIDLGESALYSEADRQAAADIIVREIDSFGGCQLHSLTYAGDAICGSEDELIYANSLQGGGDYAEVIVFDSVFHSPVDGGGAWEADTDYTWNWTLARPAAGDWTLITYGYG